MRKNLLRQLFQFLSPPGSANEPPETTINLRDQHSVLPMIAVAPCRVTEDMLKKNNDQRQGEA